MIYAIEVKNQQDLHFVEGDIFTVQEGALIIHQIKTDKDEAYLSPVAAYPKKKWKFVYEVDITKTVN